MSSRNLGIRVWLVSGLLMLGSFGCRSEDPAVPTLTGSWGLVFENSIPPSTMDIAESGTRLTGEWNILDQTLPVVGTSSSDGHLHLAAYFTNGTLKFEGQSSEARDSLWAVVTFYNGNSALIWQTHACGGKVGSGRHCQ